jgi:hypothetical protein
MHGVVAADRSSALLCYVQLDEPRNDQTVAMRIPGLDPARRYRATNVTPGERPVLSDDELPAADVSGAALAEIGLAVPPQRPLAAAVLLSRPAELQQQEQKQTANQSSERFRASPPGPSQTSTRASRPPSTARGPSPGSCAIAGATC